MMYVLSIALSILVVVSIIAQYYYNLAKSYKEIADKRFSYHTESLIRMRNNFKALNVDREIIEDLEKIIVTRIDLDESLEIKFDTP